jgi:hypothetical protein
VLGGHQLFGYKEDKANGKNSYWQKAVVMLFVSVKERVYPDEKGKSDHEYFKSCIVDKLKTEDG